MAKLMSGDIPSGGTRELHDNPNAPEIFADGYQGIMTDGQTCKFNLYTRAFNRGPEVAGADRVELAARIVMGLNDFLATVDALSIAATSIREQLAKAPSERPKINVH